MFSLGFQPLGVDFFCLGKKFLTFNLISRNLKIKYRRSILGAFWTLLAPLAMAVVYYVVFKMVLKVSIPHYLVFILAGILPWNFFSQSAIEGMESLVGSFGLISKVPIPIQIFPYVGAITNLVTLLIALPIILGAAFLSHVPLGASMVLLPVYLLVLFLITYSVSLILAVAFVFFRDLRHLMGIVMQLWFYATPVLYDTDMIPARWRWTLGVNPLADVFTGIHAIVVQATWPQPVSFARMVAWTLALVLGAILTHRSCASGIVEQI